MPSEQFKRSVALNLEFWLGQAEKIDDFVIHDLDQEHFNIMRAVQFGMDLEETFPASINLIVFIFPLIERRGYWRQWIPMMEMALGKCALMNTAQRMDLLECLGQCYRLDRRWDEAISVLKEGEIIANSQGSEENLAKFNLRLSQVYLGTRDYDLCSSYGETALAQLKNIVDVDQEYIGAATSILGLLSYGRGEHDSAEQKLNEAASIYRQLQQPALLGRSLMNLALSLEASGKGGKALTLYKEALSVLEGTEYELDKVRVEISLGTLHINEGRLEEAEAAFVRANSPFLQNSGLVYYQALIANNLGNTYLEMGDLETAEKFLRQSISLWRIAGGRLMLANTVGTLAELTVAQGDCIRARQLFEEAIEIAQDFPDDAWGRRLLKKYKAATKEIEC